MEKNQKVVIVEKKKSKKFQIPVFIIDASALRSVFEGKECGKELIETLSKVKTEGMPHLGFTTMSNFLSAVYTSDKKFFDLERVKKVLDTIQILPSMANFKDEKKLMKETIALANLMSKVSPKKLGAGKREEN